MYSQVDFGGIGDVDVVIDPVKFQLTVNNNGPIEERTGVIITVRRRVRGRAVIKVVLCDQAVFVERLIAV